MSTLTLIFTLTSVVFAGLASLGVALTCTIDL